MKTPTIIVRLIGFYLTAYGVIGLQQVHTARSMSGPGGFGAQEQVISNLQAYAVVGIIVGLAAIIFAAPLAKILTFDAE